jgi:hypothetical protein
MIELDLFGIWGKRIIEECENDSRYRIRLEEVEKIPEEYLGKEFAGRISFADEDTSWIKDVFSEFGYGGRDSVNDDYKVVSGYFPMGFRPTQNILFDWTEFEDELEDELNIADEYERCEHEKE